MGAPASVRKLVTTATPVSVFSVPANSTIHVQPGSGGTMTCKVRIHPDDALIVVDPATASYAAAATIALLGPVYEIQCAASTTNGAFSVAY